MDKVVRIFNQDEFIRLAEACQKLEYNMDIFVTYPQGAGLVYKQLCVYVSPLMSFLEEVDYFVTSPPRYEIIDLDKWLKSNGVS